MAKTSSHQNTSLVYALPKKAKRTEAKVDGKVAAWFLKNWPHDVALEVKVNRNPLLPHQKAALKQVLNGKFCYKLPDQGTRQPFDYVVLKNADAVFCVVAGKNVTCTVNGNQNITFKI